VPFSTMTAAFGCLSENPEALRPMLSVSRRFGILNGHLTGYLGPERPSRAARESTCGAADGRAGPFSAASLARHGSAAKPSHASPATV
jgi:hypothetical protein